MRLAECSLYGIRIYQEGAVLAPHVVSKEDVELCGIVYVSRICVLTFTFLFFFFFFAGPKPIGELRDH